MAKEKGKYHFNKVTGALEPCKATKRACPNGGAHFDSIEEGEAYQLENGNVNIQAEAPDPRKILENAIKFAKKKLLEKSNKRFTLISAISGTFVAAPTFVSFAIPVVTAYYFNKRK